VLAIPSRTRMPEIGDEEICHLREGTMCKVRETLRLAWDTDMSIRKVDRGSAHLS